MTDLAERACTNLNTSVLRLITSALQEDPAADLESVLHKAYSTYGTKRRQAESRSMKVRDTKPIQKLLLHPKKCHFLPSGPFKLVTPFTDRVHDLLSEYTGKRSIGEDVTIFLANLVISGYRLWECGDRMVVQLSEDVVVKIGQGLDHDEAGLLDFLAGNLPSIPAPKALGIATIGETSFSFMSRIHGETLERRWPTLNAKQEQAVQKTLNDMLLDLRRIPFHPGTPLGSFCGRQICKDIRISTRTSESRIFSEAKFNDFLISCPTSRASTGFRRWLRSMLKNDHKIVLNHGDLHPRNIMILDKPGGDVTISGIINWEMGGFYPEYRCHCWL